MMKNNEVISIESFNFLAKMFFSYKSFVFLSDISDMDNSEYYSLRDKVTKELSNQVRYVPIEERKDTGVLPVELLSSISHGNNPYGTVYLAQLLNTLPLHSGSFFKEQCRMLTKLAGYLAVIHINT